MRTKRENPSPSDRKQNFFFLIINQHRNTNELHIPYEQIWLNIINKCPVLYTFGEKKTGYSSEKQKTYCGVEFIVH